MDFQIESVYNFTSSVILCTGDVNKTTLEDSNSQNQFTSTRYFCIKWGDSRIRKSDAALTSSYCSTMLSSPEEINIFDLPSPSVFNLCTNPSVQGGFANHAYPHLLHFLVTMINLYLLSQQSDNHFRIVQTCHAFHMHVFYCSPDFLVT